MGRWRRTDAPDAVVEGRTLARAPRAPRARRQASDRPAVLPDPLAAAPTVPTTELAVALVGPIGRLVERLRDDVAGEWPMVEELPGAPASELVPAVWRADAVWYLVRSTCQPRSAVVPRLLSIAERFDVLVDAVVPLDAVVDVDHGWLDRELLAWAEAGDAGASRERLEVLAGPRIAARLARLACDPTIDTRVRSASVWVLARVVANTPDVAVLRRALEVAVDLVDGEAFDRRLAGQLLQWLHPAGLLVRHLALPSPGEVHLTWLAAQPGWRIKAAALELLRCLPGTRQRQTVDLLLWLADHGRSTPPEDALPALVRAVSCLADAPPEPQVIELLGELFRRSPVPEVRREAGASLVRLLGDDARPVLVELLTSSDVGDIAAGEALLLEHGTTADLEMALQAVRRLLRRRGGEELLRHPPRGAHLLAFLAGHRGDVRVDAMFVEVAAMWDHLSPELRAWAGEHLPWLGPLT